MSDTGIGASVKRKEDFRFLTGQGRYTDDIDRPGQLYAYFVRSPHAHAKIKGIDKADAEKVPGVRAIFTGADMAADNVGSLPCGWVVNDRNGEPHKAPPHFPLARDKARYVGDHVAVVIAETYAQAKEAGEQVMVDYEELPAAARLSAALDSGAPLVHDEAPGNLCYDWVLGDEAEADAAFAKAAHITKVDLVNNRLVPNAMEPRAAIGEYDGGTDELYPLHHQPEPAPAEV